MRSSYTALVLAALSVGDVVASPTHRHAHRHLHKKATDLTPRIEYDTSNVDWSSLDVDWAAAYANGQASKSATAAAADATATKVETPVVVEAGAASSTEDAATTSKTASSSSGSSKLWNGLVGCSNDRTSFGTASGTSGSAGDAYMGNVGSPYGSNVIKVASSKGYDYTNTFVNTWSQGMTVVIWNKVGPDGQSQSGHTLAPTEPTLTFYLSPGDSQTVAFMANTQVAWAQAVDAINPDGSFSTSWGEANFGSGTGSGYDLSAIPNGDGNTYQMSISAKECTCVSDPTQNFWLTATQPIGDSNGSCYIYSDAVATLTTHMGGPM